MRLHNEQACVNIARMINKPLTLVPISSSARKVLTPDDKLDLLENEVRKALELRLEILRDEAEVLKSDMDAALGRIRKHGQHANLRDIKTGRWYQVATEIKCFQDFARYIASLRGTSIASLPPPSVEDE